MRRITMAAFMSVLLFAILSIGCLDREPAPVCPVPTEIVKNEKTASDFDGVDLLVSVDNSGSMAEEQQILSTGFYTLINSLTLPLSPEVDKDWGYPPVNNMRVAVVSSDMGLQWGEKFEDGVKDGGKTGGNTTEVTHCEDTGLNGAFLGVPDDVTVVEVRSGQIKCEDGGNQCPSGFNCNNENRCVASDGAAFGAVNCPDTQLYVQTLENDQNFDLSTQVACMGQQGTSGCGVEQQLESAVRGLENYTTSDSSTNFLVDTHLLAVLMVSDEEDCSIRDKGLFETEEWLSGASEHLNVACNWPEENETFLFPANSADRKAILEADDDADATRLDTYYNRLVAMKEGRAAAVIFAAIVGVPHENGDGEQDNTCQGDGLELQDKGCLEHDDMQMDVGTFSIEVQGQLQDYKHFQPACQRFDGNGEEVTGARPGRRFVKVAQDFGKQGYVYSICNEDWSPAMRKIAEIIARQITPTCYPKQLDWELKKDDRCEELDLECGQAKCDVVVEFQRSGANVDDRTCGDVYKALDDDDKKRMEAQKQIEDIKSEDGSISHRIVRCPLPKIATPLDCDEAASIVRDDEVGWYYCEKQGEYFYSVCHDGIDNDDDNENGIINDPDDAVDCDDEDCQYCCDDTNLVNCEQGCRYGVEITDAAKKASTGQFIKVICLSRFQFEDSNCQEDSRASCYEPKLPKGQGIDNDGNGLYNCIDTFVDENESYRIKDPETGEKIPTRPDPNCCPMDMDEDGNCVLSGEMLYNLAVNCLPDSKSALQKSQLDSKEKDFWNDYGGPNLFDELESLEELDGKKDDQLDLEKTKTLKSGQKGRIDDARDVFWQVYSETGDRYVPHLDACRARVKELGCRVPEI